MKIIKEESKKVTDNKLKESTITYNEFGWYTDSNGDTYFKDIESSILFNTMLFNDEIDTNGNIL